MKKILLFILMISLSLTTLSFDPFNNKMIIGIKNGHFAERTEATVNDVFKKNFEDVNWRQVDSQGDTFVVVTGKYWEKADYEEVIVVFKINKVLNRFDVVEYYLNEIEQDPNRFTLLYNNLIDRK